MNLPAMQETQVRILGGEDPLEKDMATHSSILAWKSHRQRSLASYSPWGRKEFYTAEATLACTHTGGMILTENQLETGGRIPE